MNKLYKVLDSITQFNPLLDLIGAGFTPADIKELNIATLDKYFRNKDVLKELATSSLVSEALNLVRLQQCPWAFKGFRRCLSLYRSAHAVDDSTSLEACASWEKDVQKGLSQYWSAFQLQSSLSALELEEFALESFRTVGVITEANIKPHLKDLLNQVRIIKRESDLRVNLSKMSLGDLVRELLNEDELVDLLMPSPWRVELNQWRNIAQHQSFDIEGDAVICQYGIEPRVSKILLTRDELEKVTHSLFSVFGALKLARTIFVVDNIKKMKEIMLQNDPRIRIEQEILVFTSAVNAQGFKVIELRLTDDAAVAVLQDVTDQDPAKRCFHASQLVHQLWNITERPRVTIEYREKDGTRSLVSTVSGKDCERLSQGDINLEKFVKRTDFNDLKLGKRIPAENDL